uniref:Uncharacterized protein n=1 Tax=Octopus bimaculoides TaxID=37653 RepID=A0A0L8GLG0_OCTBM
MSSLRNTRRNSRDKQTVNGKNSTEKNVGRQEPNAKNYKRPMKIMTLNKNGRLNMRNKKTDILQMYRQLLLKTGQMEKFRKLGKVKQRQFIRRLMLKNRKIAKLKTQNEMNHIHQISRVPELNQDTETSHVTGLSHVSEKATTESSNRFSNTPTSRNTTLLNVWTDGMHNDKHVSLKNEPSYRSTSHPLKSYKKDYRYSPEENQRSQKHKKEQVMQQKFDSFQREKGKNRKPFLVMTSPNMIDSGTHQPNAFMFNQNGDVVHYRGSSYQTIYPEFEQQRSFTFKNNMPYLRDIPNTSQADIKTKKEEENSSENKIDDENNAKKRQDENADNEDDVDNEIKKSSAEDKDKYDSHQQTQTRLPATFTIRAKNYNDMSPSFRTPRYDFTQQFNRRQKKKRLIQRGKLHLPSKNLPLKTFRNKFRVNRRQNRYGMLRETPPWSKFRANIGQPSQFVMISSDRRKDMPIPRKEDQDSSEDTSESEQSQFSPPYYHTLSPGLNSMDIAGGFQYNYHPYAGNDQLDQQNKVDYYQQYPITHVEDNNEDSSDENTSIEQEQGDETDYQEPPSYVGMHGSDVALDTGRVNEVNHFYGESTIVPLGQLKHDQDDDDQDDNINSSENAVEETSEEQDNQKQMPENIHKNRDSPDTLLIVLDNDSKTKKNIDNEEHNQFKQSSAEDFTEGKKASPIMKADHSLSNGILVILDNDGEKPISTIKPTPAIEKSKHFPEDKPKQSAKTIKINVSSNSSSLEMSNKYSYSFLNETSNKHSYKPLNITKSNESSNNSSNNFTKTITSINDISFSLNSSDQSHRPSFSVNSSNQLYRTSLKPLRPSSEKKNSLNNLLIELGTKDNIFNIRTPSRGISQRAGDYHKGISESKSLRKDQRFRLVNKSRPVTNRYKSNGRKIKKKFRYKNIGHPFKNVRRTGNSNISMRKRFRKLYPNIHFQADTELFGNRVREVVEIPDIDWTLNGSTLEGDSINLLKKSKSTENKTITSGHLPQEDLSERLPQNNNVIRGIHAINTNILDSQKTDSQSIEDDNRYRKIPLEYPKDVDEYRLDHLHGIPNVFTVVSNTKDDDDDDDSAEYSQSNHNLVINTIKYKSPNIDMNPIDSLNPVYLNTLKDIRNFVDTHSEDKDDFNERLDEEREEVQENMEYSNKQPAFHPLLARGREDSYKTVSNIQLNNEKMSPVYREISGSQEEFPDIERDHVIGDYHYPKFDQLKTKIQLPTELYQDRLYGIDSDDENEELPLMYRDIMYKKRLSKHDNNRMSHDNDDTFSTSERVNTMNTNKQNNLNNFYVLGNKPSKLNHTVGDFHNNSRIKVNHPLMSHNSISALYGQSPLNPDETYDSVEDSNLDSTSMADELNYRNKKRKLISSSSHSLHNKILVTGADTPGLLGSTKSERTLNENRLKNTLQKKTSSLFKSHLRNRDKLSDDASIRSIEGVRSDQEFYRTSSGRKSQILGQENREIYLPRDFHSSEMIWRNGKSPLRGIETQDIPRQYWRIYQLLKNGNLPEKYRPLYYHLKDEIDKIANKSSQEFGGRPLEDESISGDFGTNTFEENNKNWRDTSFDIGISNPKWNDTLAYEESRMKEKTAFLNDKDYNMNSMDYQKLHKNFSDYELTKGHKSENSYPLVDEQLHKTQYKNYFDENSPGLFENGVHFGVHGKADKGQQKHDINTNSRGPNSKVLGPNDQESIQYPTENGSPLTDIIENHQYENVYNYHGSIYDPYDYLGEVDISQLDPVEKAFQIPYNSVPESTLTKFDNQGNHLESSDLTNTNLQKNRLMKDNSNLLTQYSDEMNLNGRVSPEKQTPSIDKDTEKIKSMSRTINIDKPGIFGSDFQEKSDQVVLDKYLSHDVFQKVYESQGEGKRLHESHEGRKHLQDSHGEKKRLQDTHGERKHVQDSHGERKHLQDSHGERKRLQDTHGERKHLQDTHGERKHLQDNHGEIKHLQDSHEGRKYLQDTHGERKHLQDSHGERKHLQDTHGERKHAHDNRRERKQGQGSHEEKKYLHGNFWEGKHSQDSSRGDRKPSHDSLWEGKHSKHSRRRAKPFQHSRSEAKILQSHRDINDDEDDSKTQEIDIAKPNDNELTEDIDDGDAKHYSGNNYYSDIIVQPLGLTEKNLPNTFQISPSNVFSTSATIIHRNKTTEESRTDAKETDVKYIDHKMFSVTQKKIFKSSLPVSVSNLEGTDNKWLYSSTDNGDAIRNVSSEEKQGKQFVDVGVPLTSSHPSQFQNISRTSDAIDIDGSRFKEISNITEETESQGNQSLFLDRISFEPTLSDLDSTSVKIKKYNTHQRLVTFGKDDHQVSKHGSSELGGISRSDFNSSQIYEDPTFRGEMVQADDANATEIPQLTSANDFLIYDENYDLLPEESSRDEKNSSENLDEVHDDSMNTSVHVEGTVEKWGRGGHSIKPTTSLSDDKNIDDIAKKDTENDPLKSQPSYMDESEHLLAEIELGESFPQLEDKKIPHTPEEEYREHQHHMGASPINRDIHQLHQILPDILVEEPDISHKPTVLQTTTALKDTEKHVKISETVKKETVPAIDIDKQVFFKGSDIDKEKKRITGRTEASKLDFFEHDSFQKPETLMMETTEETQTDAKDSPSTNIIEQEVTGERTEENILQTAEDKILPTDLGFKTKEDSFDSHKKSTHGVRSEIPSLGLNTKFITYEGSALPTITAGLQESQSSFLHSSNNSVPKIETQDVLGKLITEQGEKTSKESYTGTTRDIKADPDMKTLGLLQSRKEVKTFNKTGLQDKLDIVKSDTTLLGIEELIIHESKPQSTLQGSDKSQSQHHEYLDGILQSTDKSRSRQPTTKVGTLQSGEPFETDVTIKGSGKLKEYEAPAKYVTLQGRQTSMKSKSTVMDGTAHDIDISRSPKTIQINDSIYSSGSKLHGYESSTQLHDTYEHKATHVGDSTSYSREKSKKSETTLQDSISQATEEKRLPSLSHLDGASLGADISKIYVEPTQAVSTLRDTSQLHEASYGRGDSRGHTPIQVNHTMQHIEELRGQQPTQLYGTLPGKDEHKHTPVQLDDALLGIDESHKLELSHTDNTSQGPEKEIFHEAKLHNASHSIDEVRRHEMIKLQNISYDIEESKRNESTQVLNTSLSIDKLKEHKPIQLNTTLDSTDISHRLGPSLLDGSSHATSEFYRQESTIVDYALHGIHESKEYEPTQIDGTSNVGTSKLNEYEPTIDGTLHDTSELFKHNQSQLYGTSHGTDAFKRQEPVQLEGTVNIGSDKQGEYEPTQLSGTSHDTGRLINDKSSLLDGVSDGFNKSHGQELIQIDGIDGISYDTGGLHGPKLSKLDGTLRDTGELYGHKSTELASTLHGHKPTQTDDISHITKGLSEQEASLLDSSTYSTDRRRQETDELPGHKPSSPDSTPYSTDGLHGYESSQVDGISYRIKESTSHKLTQANGSLYNVTESRNHSEPHQYDTWHSLNKYETTQSDGNRQSKGIFRSSETVRSDVDLPFNETSKHGEATKTDDGIKLTSYRIPKLTGVSLESDGSSRQHGTLHVTDDNLQDSKSNVMGDSSHVTDKMKSHRQFKFDHTVSSSDKSRITQSAKQYISLDDTEKSKTLDSTWRRTDELGMFQTPKTDIIYHSTERPKSYEPVGTYDMLHGSTNIDGTLQDTDILRGYDPSQPDASPYSTDKEGVYVSKTDEASHGTDKIISYDPTNIFGTSHDADRIKSSYTMQVDDTPHHTSKYIDRIKSYDPTKVSDDFQVSVKSKFSEPTKTGTSIAESVLDKHTPTTYSKSGDGILREISGYEFLHPGYRTTIKSNGRSWIKVPPLDNSFRKEIQDTDHQISDDTLYQTSFTDKHFDRDGITISATKQIKGEKAVTYGDVSKKVDRGEPKFVSSTSEPSKDGKVLSLDGETQKKTDENYVDSHKMPIDMPGVKTETSTDATLKLIHDTSLSSSKETGQHSVSEQTHAYPSLVTRSPVDKQKTEKDLAINASAKRTDDLSSVIFTDSITKEVLSTKSEDFPKENVMDSFSSLKPKVSSSKTSAPHQTFSGISSILDKKQDQKQLKTLLDLPSTLLFGQLMDVGLTSKGSHPESQDTHSSIEVDVDRTEHFPGFDALRQLTGSAPKEKEKIVTEIASDLFQTKHQDVKPFIEKKIPTVKTPTVKFKQSVDKSRFNGLKNVSLRHPGKSNESIFSDFDTESDQIPIQHTITMTPHTKAEGSVTDIDHKLKSPERDDRKLHKITQPYSIKVEPGLETDLIDEGIPLPEYTSFVNYQDSIDPGASTSEVPIHIQSTFNKSFTKTDEKEKLFPEMLHSNIPSYETPVLDFTEDDRKILMDRTTPNAHLNILSSKKQRFHASYSPDQYQKPTKTGRPYATTGYPSMIEHFDRKDIMKFHIPGDTTISTHPESTLPHTPKIPTEKTMQFRKGTPGITNNMKSLRQQSDRFLQIVTPSIRRSDIKNIWEDNSNLMLNLYETSRFTKASFLRKNESACEYKCFFFFFILISLRKFFRLLKVQSLEISFSYLTDFQHKNIYITKNCLIKLSLGLIVVKVSVIQSLVVIASNQNR